MTQNGVIKQLNLLIDRVACECKKNTIRRYRVRKNNNVEDRKLFGAWDFEYKNEKYGWRYVRNYNIKNKLKEIVQNEGVDYLEVLFFSNGEIYIEELVYIK